MRALATVKGLTKHLPKLNKFLVNKEMTKKQKSSNNIGNLAIFKTP